MTPLRTLWRRLGPVGPWLGGWIAGLSTAGVIGLAVALYLFFGGFDVSAAKLHARPVAWVTHSTMINSVSVRAAAVHAPARFTPDQVEAGFRLYDADCAVCHGGPGVARAAWVAGMTPTPPFLMDSARRWSPAELDLIIGDGVKMTAMPAWRMTRSSQQVWDLVAFLEALPNLSPATYAGWRAKYGSAAAARPADQPPR